MWVTKSGRVEPPINRMLPGLKGLEQRGMLALSGLGAAQSANGWGRVGLGNGKKGTPHSKK